MSDFDTQLPSEGEVVVIAGLLSEGKGSPEEAKSLLRLFCHTVATAGPGVFPPHLIDWLVLAFRAHVEKGKSLDIALGLRRGKGRPGGMTKERNARIAADVMRVHRDEGLPLAETQTGYSAFSAVGARWHLSPEQVREIYYTPEHQEFGALILRLEDHFDSGPSDT
jgi:hypothetical protein